MACVFLGGPAMAHPHHSMSNPGGFAAGFAHPWLGIDHLLAMVAVGVLAVRIGGSALWGVPVTFLAFLAVGGVIGLEGFETRLIEAGIALSVIVLGVALASGKKYPLGVTLVGVAAMALFHGHVHGAELPAMAAPGTYAVGLLVATALLHLLGVAAGMYLTGSVKRTAALRFSGAVIAIAGAAFLFQA
ncbi:HupE/UreJ family protein [Roseiconus lacunae]|uniref:HupE/UreJ family protein n=1 Tax=Roseiconus lacunae TaxID=2605694 RepID=UPI0021BC4CCE|nr:HupE/UreJ family protein [Roseiconus lacunae]